MVLRLAQHVLRLDGQDEGGAARDGGDPRAVLQQSFIMNRQAPRVGLFDNIKGMFAKKKTE